MGKYHPLKELAPRDIVARSIIREMLVQKETNVNLDATAINKDILLNHFPNIVETCRSIGIDPCSTPIPVVPAAHYSCGGIGVDEHSKTTLKGLYAIGECSHTGLHGANRLASNSLLESIVFSHRAALNSVENLMEITLSSSFYEAIPDWKGQHFSKDNQQEVTHTLSEQLRKIMSEQVGIFKTTEGLITAQTNIKKLYFAVVDLYNSNKLSPQICELRNMVSVAYVLVNQSLELTKNKGVFYNHNYGKEPVL